jgi:hypothetical protein
MPSRAAPLASMPPRVPYASTINQRKRERRRRTREAMYRELQDLVLKHVHVRVRADGRIYQDNERVTLQISPNLEINERYNFLIENLAPKPRRAERTNDITTRRRDTFQGTKQESRFTRSENDENRARRDRKTVQGVNTAICSMTSVQSRQHPDSGSSRIVLLLR